MQTKISRRDMLKGMALAAGGAVLSACGAQPTPTVAPESEQEPAANPPAIEPVNLTMWTYPGDVEFLTAMFDLYKAANPDVNLEITKIELSDMDQKMTTALVAGSGLPDMADIEQGWFRKWVYSPGLVDFMSYGAESHKAEMPVWCWEAGLSPDKSKQLFLYYSVGVAVVHYRRSLFEKAGLASEPEDVQALISTDWPSNLDVGGQISKPDGPWMYDAASTVFNAYRDQFNPVWFDDETKKFMIDVPAMLDGVRLALDARERGLDAKMAQWTPEWTNTFKNTTVATYPIGDWLPILLKDYGGEATKGDWGMVTCPGDTGASAGGSLFCAFQQSKHPDVAANVLTFFTFDLEAQMQLIKFYNLPSLIKAWDDQRMSEPVEWYAGQKTRLVSVAGARKFSNRKYTPYDNECSTIMDTELTNVLNNSKDPQQALFDAQKTAETQIVLKED
jgi:multiple sugar transport system substrate-binding protein